MPRIERSAEVSWEGNVARGAGRLSGATGAFTELPFTLASRIESPEGKTSPEELLAAAHAGCFTMSLGSELVRDGTPAETIHVTCKIVMDEIPGEGHQIVGAELEVSAAAKGARPAALAAAIERANEACPFSTLLKKAGATVTVSQS